MSFFAIIVVEISILQKFQNVKIVLFTIKWVKIILLLRFLWRQSVWWLYVQSAINMDFIKWMFVCVFIMSRKIEIIKARTFVLTLTHTAAFQMI